MSVIERLKNFEMEDTKVLEAERVAEGYFRGEDGNLHEELPVFYRVKLQMTPGEGSLIFTEVWLPEEWNGIFLAIGGGGMAASIDYWSLARRVREHYAVANTDMGTSRGRKCGISNPDVWKDFGWRATHLMAPAGKGLVEACYGKAPDYSYFMGNSTGGQQALCEAQRFPKDYDGITAGVPGNNRTHLHTYFLWNHLHLRTADGKKMFSKEEIAAITDCAVEFFQARKDGEPGDNFISFPTAEPDTIAAFLNLLAEKRPDFKAEQLDALHAVYSGPVNPVTGERIYCGMPLGSECYECCGIEEFEQEESPHFYPFIWAFGENYNGRMFDFDKDLDALNEKLAGDLNANDPDLSAFCAHGGKLLIYSGSADPCVPFPDAIRYYERVLGQGGGYESVSDYCRYYLFPGRDHIDRGNGTNAIWADEKGGDELTALRRWREEHIAPDRMLAVRCQAHAPNGIAFIRPVYPYGSAEYAKNPSAPAACADRYVQRGNK
ncbi:MAG: tannase/feruloyl esterase family alpha/beta hydrolase [Lachnospiraceae bacterium]|nr:tannase/feruloyl esterase family alpha/beta hydrolase [Lachnospiraceae bacterium]